MVGLQRADQDACIYKHVLNVIGVDALAANCRVAQKRCRAVVTFRPLMKTASPFFRIDFLQVSKRSELCVRKLPGDLFNPPLNRQPACFGLGPEGRSLLFGKLNCEVQTTSLLRETAYQETTPTPPPASRS